MRGNLPEERTEMPQWNLPEIKSINAIRRYAVSVTFRSPLERKVALKLRAAGGTPWRQFRSPERRPFFMPTYGESPQNVPRSSSIAI